MSIQRNLTFMAASGNTSSMQDTGKSVLKTAGAAFALCAIAYASGSHESNADVKARTNPPEMKLVGSADEQIRTTVTQGVAETADQCTSTATVELPGVTPGAESAPQYKTR